VASQTYNTKEHLKKCNKM